MPAPDPDPTAADLAAPQTRAECVAWLRKRSDHFIRQSEIAESAGAEDDADEWYDMGRTLELAAQDLEDGEEAIPGRHDELAKGDQP